MSIYDHWMPFFLEWHIMQIAWGFVICTFGLITILRGFEPTGVYYTRWTTFKIGDTLCLPVFVANASYIIQDFPHTVSNAWYTQVWWYIALYAVGLAFSLAIEWQEHKGGRDKRILTLISQLTHTFIVFPVALALVCWEISVLATLLYEGTLETNELVWLLLYNAALGLVGYGVTLWWDKYKVRRDPQTVTDR